jgi:RNA recognition motif-containing protein
MKRVKDVSNSVFSLGDAKMAKKLYVGGLPYSADENKLREIFEPFGALESAIVVNDKFSGRSKGFGFVEFADQEAAAAAIAQVNGQDLDGRTLTVNEARPKQPREGGFGGGRRERY